MLTYPYGDKFASLEQVIYHNQSAQVPPPPTCNLSRSVPNMRDFGVIVPPVH